MLEITEETFRAALADTLQAGKEEEQQRIIKLLETEKPCRLKGTHHDIGVCSCLVIALIKGETK